MQDLQNHYFSCAILGELQESRKKRILQGKDSCTEMYLFLQCIKNLANQYFGLGGHARLSRSGDYYKCVRTKHRGNYLNKNDILERLKFKIAQFGQHRKLSGSVVDL